MIESIVVIDSEPVVRSVLADILQRQVSDFRPDEIVIQEWIRDDGSIPSQNLFRFATLPAKELNREELNALSRALQKRSAAHLE